MAFLSWIKELKKAEIRENIHNQGLVTSGYLLLLSLSGVIAMLGLIIDNTPVVIGAMIISPIMWTILDSAMAVVRGRLRNFYLGLFKLILASSIVLGISILITLLAPFSIPTEEILLRTSPTFLDLLIALASGAVAALCVSWPHISGSIAGVAIATSLIPPLSVAGFGIAKLDMSIWQGSLLLYVSNLLAILFIAIVCFWALGFKTQAVDNEEASKAIWHGFVAAAGMLIAVSIPLMYILQDTVQSEWEKEEMINAASKILQGIDREVEIESFFIRKDPSGTHVDLSIIAPQYVYVTKAIQDELVHELENISEEALHLEIRLTPYVKAGESALGQINLQIEDLEESFSIKEEQLRNSIEEQIAELESIKEQLWEVDQTVLPDGFTGTIVLPSINRIE